MLSFIYAYYDNPKMYRRQVKEWDAYPEEVKKHLSIFVTDDCSKKHPLREIEAVPSGITIRRFEITKKVPWNWLACRNLGAWESDKPWLLLTDMDHLVSVENAIKIMHFLYSKKARRKVVYLFTRQDAPNNTPYKPHNDSFMMTKSLFWQIGGYDEELAGHYGTSSGYRNRAFATAKNNKRLNIPLIRYPRQVIADASTTDFPRKSGDRGSLRRVRAAKKDEGRANEIRILSFPYKEIL